MQVIRSVTIILALSLLACGASMSREEALPKLRHAIESPVSSPEESQESSRLVQSILDQSLLHGMFRQEVIDAIGRGDPCSRHPACAEHDFSGDDFFYTVGVMGEGRTGALPQLIVGFDTSGRVVRTWNLRTH